LALVYQALIGGSKQNLPVKPFRSWPRLIAYGLLEMRRGDRSKADTQYRTALRLDPAFVPAMVYLADLDRARGKDEQGAELLRKADVDRTQQCRCAALLRALFRAAA
jgi:hypothetical protein